MQLGILITNNIVGNHPADKWADVTVGRIMAVFDIADEATGTPEAKKARRDKRFFEANLLDIVTNYHQEVHDREQAALTDKAGLRLHESMESHDVCPDLLDKCVAEIVAQADINPAFASYFAQPEVQKHIRNDMLAPDFTCAIHANRLGHCDLNPTDTHVVAWKKGVQHHGANVGHIFMQQHLPEHLRTDLAKVAE
jgi:hypothetical protein